MRTHDKPISFRLKGKYLVEYQEIREKLIQTAKDDTIGQREVAEFLLDFYYEHKDERVHDGTLTESDISRIKKVIIECIGEEDVQGLVFTTPQKIEEGNVQTETENILFSNDGMKILLSSNILDP